MDKSQKFKVQVIKSNGIPNLDEFKCVNEIIEIRVKSAMKKIYEAINGNQG